MKTLTKLRSTLLVTTVAMCTLSSITQARPGGGGGRSGPPEAAIEACADLSIEGVCEFSGRHGDSVAGTCSKVPSDEQTLACLPNDHGNRDHEKPNPD